MKATIEIMNFDVVDVITTSTNVEWDDGNITPPTKEDN